MTPVDVNVFTGGAPYREVPHPEPAVLARVLAREGVGAAWVADLPSAFGADPHARSELLFESLAPHADVLRPVITVDPARAGWEDALARGATRGAVAVRGYARGDALRALAARSGAAGMPLLLAAHLEPAAEAHFAGAGAATVRDALGASAEVRVVVTGAARALIEETEAAVEPAMRARLWWEISRIAGPPADDLAVLVRAMGASRFVYGSGWPLRLTQVPRANLELLPSDLAGSALAAAPFIARP